MADLKYDTDALRCSADKYRQIGRELESVKTDLKKQIADLKAVHWKSDAGAAFMKMYEDNWSGNVEKYIAVLNEMAGLLDRAGQDYDSVTREIKTIPGIM